MDGGTRATLFPLCPRARRRVRRHHPTGAQWQPAHGAGLASLGGTGQLCRRPHQHGRVVIALGERVPSWKTVVDVPWYAWSGGVFGAAFILLAILLLPSLGAATLFALAIAGQVLAAGTLDHFGAFGLPPAPISAARLAGAVLLIAGVVLIRD